MSDIFISYASEDKARVEPLVGALAAQGWSVWWDRAIPAGKTFDDVIEEAVNAASCVVVVWSDKSVSSRWVRTEAEEGANRQILIPVLIDDVRIPLAFRRIQAANLIGWQGDLRHPGFDQLVKDISSLLRTPPAPQVAERFSNAYVVPLPGRSPEPALQRASASLPERNRGVGLICSIISISLLIFWLLGLIAGIAGVFIHLLLLLSLVFLSVGFAGRRRKA